MKRKRSTRVNHLYRDIPAMRGSVAVCGHVKILTLGFDASVPTCTGCVDAVIGQRVIKQPHEKF